MRARIATVAASVPRVYWYVWWGTLVNRLGGFVVPLLTIYLIQVRKLSVADAGGIVSLYGAGAIAASLAGGELSDRLGRRITMLISLFGGAVAMIALAFARDLTAIAALVCVYGFLGELYRPAVLAFIADVVPPANRVHAYGLLHWVINLGFSVALIVGGLLAEVDFTILFIADAATMVGYGVIVWIAVPETRPPRVPVAAVGRRASTRSWLTDAPFVVMVVLTLLIAVVSLQASATLSAHMTWQGFAPSAFGAVAAVNGILIIVFQPSLITWAARRDPSRVLIGASLLYGVGVALHGLADSFAVHALAVVVWTLGEILESPSRAAIVAAMAPADARGRYQGAVMMAFGCSQLVSPKLGTWVWEHVEPDAVWGGCLALGIAVAFAHAVAAPSRRRRMAAGLSDPSPSGSS